MVICAVPNCFERTGKRGKKWRENRHGKVTFHRIPDRMKEIWAKSLGLNVESMNKNTRICSCHFHEKMFDRTGSTARLRENAVPQNHTIYTRTQPLNENGKVSKKAEGKSVLHGAFNPSILEVITSEHSYVSNAPPSSSDKKSIISIQEDLAINPPVECILNSSSLEESILEVSRDDRIKIHTDSEGKSTREIPTRSVLPESKLRIVSKHLVFQPPVQTGSNSSFKKFQEARGKCYRPEFNRVRFRNEKD
ncbi:uncharacterized protein LOC117177863 [Belonocnema kinseyi]|uniref:uncharacterized protein LOC117177863 n=1 Tax=Belonocnema kinseyi TaxID=2817044 RepID=UPI00143D2F4B|nr:uncharacterized protein LOC117177863 [Belonocnema kinseyi]